jgi:hypothetical protein
MADDLRETREFIVAQMPNIADESAREAIAAAADRLDTLAAKAEAIAADPNIPVPPVVEQSA